MIMVACIITAFAYKYFSSPKKRFSFYEKKMFPLQNKE